MTHGHEVLHMMEGNSYATKQQLIDAIISRFGADERFYTCSAEDLTAAELVDFLEARGKFMPAAGPDSFTVDTSKVCNH
jgi:probable metal-binding protein